MPLNTNIDTRDLEQVVSTPAPRFAPPIAPYQPIPGNPYYLGQFPIAPANNADAVRNFQQTNLPVNRIIPLPSLSQPGLANNTAVTPVVVTKPSLLTPTPAPTIVSPLVTIPTGFQFSFNEIRLAANSGPAISTYKIYRCSSNVSAAASVFLSLPHNPASIGVPVVIQDSQPNGVSFNYWVSAVNVSGQESSLTPAQTSPINSNAGFNSSSQLASSAHINPLNATFSATSATVLSNGGSGTLINVASSTVQFGIGPVAYNAGSVDPGGFGTWYVFVDDPLYQGGAVIYQVTNSSSVQAAGDARIPFGAITTVNGSTKSGGGTTGGTTPGGGPSRVPTL